jgi:hypothetical protein
MDTDLRSITPEWIELLIKPVLEEDYDYVSPYYMRHKYDGTITNTIVYPLTRALYGKRIRQPIGGDFGFSGRLASFYLDKDVWESDVARFGIRDKNLLCGCACLWARFWLDGPISLPSGRINRGSEDVKGGKRAREGNPEAACGAREAGILPDLLRAER